MIRFGRVAAAGVAAVGLTAGGTSLAAAGAQPSEVTLAGSAAPFAAQLPAVGNVAGSQRLSVQLWLKPDLEGAQQFATLVSVPGSPSFRHFLSPTAYTARFGPTARQAEAVETWLRSLGFTGVAADAGRDYVRGNATVAAIDAAFHTTVRTYRASKQVNGGDFPLRANDSPVMLPASLAGDVLAVTGLDNAAPAPGQQPSTTPASRPEAAGASAPCSEYYGQHMLSGQPPRFGTTSFPTEGCGYTGSQLRAAYGANSTNTGTGETIALIELGLQPKMFLTLTDYAKASKLPAPSAAHYHELNLAPSCTAPLPPPEFSQEPSDVELSYAMAPGATQLVVGGSNCARGDDGMQGLFDADTAVIDGHGGHPLATVVCNSWFFLGGGETSQPPAVVRAEHALLVKAAAVGVGMYYATGDEPVPAGPASDPFATAVGGTALGLGKTGNRLFETGWSDAAWSDVKGAWQPSGLEWGAGGGPSELWPQPAYQHGVVPTALSRAPGNRPGGPVRSIPDISADASPFTGTLIGIISKDGKFTEFAAGGTEIATPQVAGMVAAAQQGQAAPFGFLNPALYKLAGTSALHDALPLTDSSPALWRAVECSGTPCGGQTFLNQFDAQGPATHGSSSLVTLKGYDNMTGLGTPNGQAFVAALRWIG
ncbi:MAG TPA: S53 family peptidase [Streptosporangiaceae bacterium]|nr:S53 family peptidase [Streptosporangiaceae bacterium]